jgi:hypothetical protein
VIVGDAERRMQQCLEASAASSTPPSCLAGLAVERKPEAPR